ncbi:MAG: outer rane lipoprotein [Verrucomicrobiota bacterium]|jgi:apolipoprotein D and lipocalin family protein
MGMSGCVSAPAGLNTLTHINPRLFRGTWYVIARLNHPAERGLTRESVSFAPSLAGNRWKVMHYGWRNESGSWEQTNIPTIPARAQFRGASMLGLFKGMIPSAVHLVAVDRSYRYALMCGPDYKQFWVLSKEADPSEESVLEMLNEAKAKGFPVEEALFQQYR